MRHSNYLIIIDKTLFNTKLQSLTMRACGIDTLLVVLACMVMQILTKIGFSVMVALIMGFRVQSHTPDPPATHFYDEMGRPHQKMRSIVVALFT